MYKILHIPTADYVRHYVSSFLRDGYKLDANDSVGIFRTIYFNSYECAIEYLKNTLIYKCSDDFNISILTPSTNTGFTYTKPNKTEFEIIGVDDV